MDLLARKVAGASEAELLADARRALIALEEIQRDFRHSWTARSLATRARRDLDELWRRGSQLSLLDGYGNESS